MNQEQIQGKITTVLGNVRSRWGEFADNDFQRVKGVLGGISGRVQTVYGNLKEKLHSKRTENLNEPNFKINREEENVEQDYH